MHTLYLVSHTHWDREWYEPFQVFRTWLVQCIDKLLDIFATSPDFQYFMLDGQTVVLEDYIEACPEREPMLRELVRAGRIQIGPWYVLPDEFLVSGEALIRNLARGQRIARAFGGSMRVGYIPDPFGHIGQMPQLLRGFSIGAAVLRRGLADEPTEVWWQGSDGTRVLTCYLRDSYDNAAWLPRDEKGFASGIQALRDSLAPHAVTANLLLMNGTDHMEPWRELPQLVRAAREQIPDAEILQASLPMYVDKVQSEIAAKRLDLIAVPGELRNPKRHHLLPGVASTRMWIKQRNARAQMRLEKWAEPSTALAARQAGAGRGALAGSERQLLSLAWKYLLQNHPHDSICGCGTDDTHADMLPRFDWVDQITNEVVERNLAALAASLIRPSDKGVPLVVFNPVAGPRTDLLLANLELPGSLEDFILLDDAGESVPFTVESRRIDEYFRAEMPAVQISPLLGMAREGRVMGMVVQDASTYIDGNQVHIDLTLAAGGEPNRAVLEARVPELQEFIAENETTVCSVRVHSLVEVALSFVARDVPEYGYRTYYLAAAPTRPPNATVGAAPKVDAIENEFFHVEPDRQDGTLTVTDRVTGAVFRGINRFVDGGDRGDLYNYCPPEHDTLIDRPSAPPEIRIARDAVRQSLTMASNYRLPKQLADDRAGRSSETTDTRIATTVSLYPGVRRIDVTTEVTNTARDHRLRVEFPTPIQTDHASADQAFDVVDRNLDLPTDTAGWVEQPRPEAPMQTFVSVSDGTTGLTLASRGLPEYEARRDAGGVSLALTLLRCVGWLSRGDLATRTSDAGPSLQTPGAQELGDHVFRYALIPHPGDWRAAFRDAFAFAAPMDAVTVLANPLNAQAGQERASMLQAAPAEFVISAIKLPEQGDGLVVRGYNIGAEPIDVSLKVWSKFGRAARVNLDEQLVAPLDLIDGQEVRLRVRPKEIVTVRFDE